MLSRLKQLISQPDVADAIDESGRVQRAAAALLIEVAAVRQPVPVRLR